MSDCIEREKAINALDALCDRVCQYSKKQRSAMCSACSLGAAFDVIEELPAADMRPVVTCADCKHNNACLTQAFVEDESRVPFDRNTFFCADGKRGDDA